MREGGFQVSRIYEAFSLLLFPFVSIYARMNTAGGTGPELKGYSAPPSHRYLDSLEVQCVITGFKLL